MDIFSVLKKCVPEVHAVEVSGGTVYIRDMDGAQYEAFAQAVRDKNREQLSDAALIGVCLCDHNGTLAFPQPAQAVDFFKDIKSADIKILVKAVMHHAGMNMSLEDVAAKEKKS